MSLVGALLVCLMFVQGAYSLVGSLGGDAEGRRLVVDAMGRKWMFTFAALVVFGGVLYIGCLVGWMDFVGVESRWLWMMVGLSFVVQAVGYVCRNRVGKGHGERTVQGLLVQNGFVGPVLVGSGLAMLLEGGKLLSVWVLVFGIALFFLARVLGTLYVISAVEDVGVRSRASARLLGSTIAFVVLFVAYLVHWLLGNDFGEMWYLITLVLIGFLLILHAVVNSQLSTVKSQLSTVNSQFDTFFPHLRRHLPHRLFLPPWCRIGGEWGTGVS